MTTIYVPRLIESAEQAEALPVNTLAISADGVDPAIRKDDGWRGIFGDPPYSHAEMVGDYALVPIEAEEQYVAPDAITYSRYVTPWEEA